VTRNSRLRTAKDNHERPWKTAGNHSMRTNAAWVRAGTSPLCVELFFDFLANHDPSAIGDHEETTIRMRDADDTSLAPPAQSSMTAMAATRTYRASPCVVLSDLRFIPSDPLTFSCALRCARAHHSSHSDRRFLAREPVNNEPRAKRAHVPGPLSIPLLQAV
jgi:hypothetical protein